MWHVSDCACCMRCTTRAASAWTPAFCLGVWGSVLLAADRLRRWPGASMLAAAIEGLLAQASGAVVRALAGRKRYFFDLA